MIGKMGIRRALIFDCLEIAAAEERARGAKELDFMKCFASNTMQ